MWNSGWLSGFIDAEGCFNCSRPKRRKAGELVTPSLRFILDQKDELDLLKEINAEMCAGAVHQRRSCEHMWRYVRDLLQD